MEDETNNIKVLSFRNEDEYNKKENKNLFNRTKKLTNTQQIKNEYCVFGKNSKHSFNHTINKNKPIKSKLPKRDNTEYQTGPIILSLGEENQLKPEKDIKRPSSSFTKKIKILKENKDKVKLVKEAKQTNLNK
jgi:hypothetical protein